MKLIVGLGNPGPEYAKTRHNAGFMTLEKLAQRHGLTGVKHKFHAGVLEGFIHQKKVMLMQPMTFMNRSGLAVGEAASFYKFDPTDILILVDEIALDVGQIRLRGAGSPGGHNGLKDIERVLTTRDYPRLRIGIGPRTRTRRSISYSADSRKTNSRTWTPPSKKPAIAPNVGSPTASKKP